MSIKDKVNETIALFCAKFPKCFVHYEGRRKPIKIGVHHDLSAEFGESISRRQIGLTLKRYTKNSGYLKSLKAGAERIDLNGNPAGVVTEEEALHATTTIAERKKPKQKKPKKQKPEPRRDGLLALREAATKRRQSAGGAA